MSGAPAGSGGEFDLETLRQLLFEELAVLAGDDGRLRSVYARHDEIPLNRRDDASAYLDERIQALRRLAQFGARRNGDGVNIYAATPDTQRQQPCISIDYSGTSAEVEAMLGDTVHEEWVQVDGKTYLARTMGSHQRRSVAVQILAESYDDTWTLYRAVKDILERSRGRLSDVGVHDVKLTETPPETMRADDDMRNLSAQLDIDLSWCRRSTELQGPWPTSVIFVNTGEAE